MSRVARGNCQQTEAKEVNLERSKGSTERRWKAVLVLSDVALPSSSALELSWGLYHKTHSLGQFQWVLLLRPTALTQTVLMLDDRLGLESCYLNRVQVYPAGSPRP